MGSSEFMLLTSVFDIFKIKITVYLHKYLATYISGNMPDLMILRNPQPCPQTLILFHLRFYVV